MPARYASIDFETRSVVDLRKTGVYPYAAHPSTAIWCFAWAFEGEVPQIWRALHHTDHHYDCPIGFYGYCECPQALNDTFPEELRAHIAAGGELRAWNAQFERVVWQHLGPRYDFPAVKPEQWVCSAAEAAAMSLPRNLADCALALGVPAQKDMAGHRLMLQMSKPRKRHEDGLLEWWDDTARRERLYEYCLQDVAVEHAIIPRLRRLGERERKVFLLDQRVNDRGLLLDRPLAEAAQQLVARATAEANRGLSQLTRGSVSAVTNSGELRAWLSEALGVEVASIAKARIKELLADPAVTGNARATLELRAEAGRSSTAKLQAMLQVAGADDRMRGLLLYHGAGTGRWAGKLVQPQNFPRPEIKKVEPLIPLVLAQAYEHLDLLYPVPQIVLSLLRSMIRAPEGRVLYAGDFSAIECRLVNWVAGQEDVLVDFEAYDAGDKRRDRYKKMAVDMGEADDVDAVTPEQRQAGKSAELGCGFGMGGEKYERAAWDVYGVRVPSGRGDEIVQIYRDTHPQVVQYWKDANRAAMQAVRQPGLKVPFGPAGRESTFVVWNRFLWLVLPSKRPLCYAAPRIEDREAPWGDVVPSVTVAGVDSTSRKWVRYPLYGGLITENVVQALARDVMVDAMLRAEEAGYEVVLTVHDEVVCETPADFGSVGELESLMRQTPTWAAGCPIAVEAWRGPRYRK